MRKTGYLYAIAVLALALPATAQADTVKLNAQLKGANEVEAGDPDGTGKFSAEIDAEAGDICYLLSGTGIGKPVAAHIHEGAAGVDGKPVITLQVTGDKDDLCAAAEPDVLKPIVATPGNFYVNIHTAEFPKGAVRGQLVR